MGMRDFFEHMKKKAQDELQPQDDSPEAKRERAKADAKKTFERGVLAFNLAKKGMKVYQQTDKTVKDVKKGVAEKTISLSDKVDPVAKKVDDLAGKVGDATKKKIDTAKVEGAAKTAQEALRDATGLAKGLSARAGKFLGQTAAGAKDASKTTSDAAVDAAAGAAKGAKDTVDKAAKGAKDTADKVAKTVGDKTDAFIKEQNKKPTTGSGLLDLIAPAVPKTDGTKSKDERKKPAPPK